MKNIIVEIPSIIEHGGYPGNLIRVSLPPKCECGGDRAVKIWRGLSYDGSRRLSVDCWQNSCGCVDTYSLVRKMVSEGKAEMVLTPSKLRSKRKTDMENCNPETCGKSKFNGEDFVCHNCLHHKRELEATDFKVREEVLHGREVWYVKKITTKIMATKLDLADAQFIGFMHGKGQSLIAMVESMGLTKREWKNWKEKYPNFYLTDIEIEEIDDHFGLSFWEKLNP